ncbi:MAG: hypothetical protein FWF38_00500 [Spirochaetaceae bacterium]|nr:hypothetical protein [Spirochaetaceae bacterium]
MKDALLEFGSLAAITTAAVAYPNEIDFGTIDARRKFGKHNNADGEMNYICIRFTGNVPVSVTITIQSKALSAGTYAAISTHTLVNPKGNVEHRIPMPAEFNRFVQVQITGSAATDAVGSTAWIQRGAAVAV